MRKFTLALFLVAVSLSSFAGWVKITSDQPASAKVNLVSSSLDKSVVHFTIPGYQLNAVQTPKGPAYTVTIGKAPAIEKQGAPDLPKLTATLAIPDMAGMKVRILSSSYQDFPGIEIAPSKGVISRTTDPASVPYTWGTEYSLNNFYPSVMADAADPFIIRDVRGQTMIVYPFRYNPVTKTLRVYTDITAELSKESETGLNPLTKKVLNGKENEEFHRIYDRLFMNPDNITYTPLNDYGKILVICHGPFMSAMKPYVDWKNASGYPTKIVDVDSIGGTPALIKTYITDYYNANGLTFVLLVGDNAQVPTNTGSGLGGPSDRAYGYIVGNDHYDDIFVGRFSAEIVGQVETQVQRTLDYEQNPDSITNDWYTTVIGIASNQGPGDDNEYDYEHIRNQQTQLLAYTYTMNPELFDGSQGGNDANGNPTPALVATAVNNGSSLILYTGHGSTTSWGTSGFNNNNVNQLTNQGKLPFIWSVACVNGEFMNTTCFAEAWLRASKNGEPTGAVGFLGSTINQSWNSPMCGQDEMTDILAESYPDNIKRTFGGLSVNGCFKMMEEYAGDGRNMSDTWLVFGDPSLNVRTSNPVPMTVIHDSVLFVGSTTLTINCDVDSARATASLHDSIIATGLVTGGTVELTFPELLVAGDTVTVVVSAYNKLPHVADILVAQSTLEAGFVGDPTQVVPGGSVNFEDSSIGFVNSWSWSFPGGEPETSTEQNPVVVYPTAGVYDVQLIVSNGVSTDTLVKTEYVTVSFPAGTPENNAASCTILPNPGKGLFKVTLTGAGEGTLEVYNITGVILRNISFSGNGTYTVDLTSMPEGVYFLSVKTGGTSMVKKLVVSR